MNCRQFPHHPEILGAMLIHLWELFANAFTAWTCFKKVQDRQNTTPTAIKQIDGMLYVIYHMTCFVGLIHCPWWQTTCKIKTPVPWSSDPWAPDHANSACTRHTKTPKWGIAAIFRTTCEFQHLTHSNTHRRKKNKHIFLNLYVNNPSHPGGVESLNIAVLLWGSG